MNIGAPWPDRDTAWYRVLVMQTKLHRWAKDDPDRCFDSLLERTCRGTGTVHAFL